MRWFLADGNQSWLCEATKGRNTRPSFSKLSAEFSSFYFHMQVLIFLSQTENICISPHNSRKMSPRNSQIIILLFSFQKVLCKNDIFRYIFARVDVESNQSCQSRRERPIKTSWPEKSGATRNHLWSRLSLSFTRRRAQKINLFCLESYEQDWARDIILLNYIKLAKRVDNCDKIASVSSYKML